MKALIVALTCLLCGSEVGTRASDGTFHSGVDLVSLNVIVTDNHDKFVMGLAQKNFSVFEDGIQQNLSFFAAADVPLDLAILLDASASMTDKMATVQEAAVGFASHLRPGDRLTVVGIKDSARTLHELDGDVKGACDAIRRTSASGGTALYNALYTTLKQLQKVHAPDGESRRQAVAVFTDGDDTTSLVTFDDLLVLAKQAGIAIYPIALKSPSPSVALKSQKYFSESEFAMRTLAQETGARSFFPTDISQLAGVYDLIMEELSNQYALGYTSNNLKQDGSFRRILVRVDEPNVRTRTRSGYQVAMTRLSLR